MPFVPITVPACGRESFSARLHLPHSRSENMMIYHISSSAHHYYLKRTKAVELGKRHACTHEEHHSEEQYRGHQDREEE